jgi:excisionase family DNA binding protein
MFSALIRSMGEDRTENKEIEIESAEATAVAGVVPLLLTIPQAALVLAVGRTTVYELIGAGDLEAVHIGRSARVPVAALQDYVERRRGGRVTVCWSRESRWHR